MNSNNAYLVPRFCCSHICFGSYVGGSMYYVTVILYIKFLCSLLDLLAKQMEKKTR